MVDNFNNFLPNLLLFKLFYWHLMVVTNIFTTFAFAF